MEHFNLQETKRTDFLMEDHCIRQYLGKEEIVVIPEDIRIIERNTFAYCDTIREVILPASLERIGEKAFYQSSLMKIYIPDGVEKIEDDAFKSCRELKEVIVEGSNTIMGAGVFDYIHEQCTGRIRCAYPENEWLYIVLHCRNIPKDRNISMDGRVKSYVKKHFNLLMDYVFRNDDARVLKGMIDLGCLEEINLEQYVERAVAEKKVHVNALLVQQTKRRLFEDMFI